MYKNLFFVNAFYAILCINNKFKRHYSFDTFLRL